MSKTGKNKEKEILFSDICRQIAFELIESTKVKSIFLSQTLPCIYSPLGNQQTVV